MQNDISHQTVVLGRKRAKHGIKFDTVEKQF